jgi:cation efflux system membrane fusion protein
VGHGDEFQQQGDVRQVKANADTDALVGVITEKPQQEPQGLTVPSAAVVDADGQSLVFVKSGSTYDPVFVEAGASSGDRVSITSGIDPTDEVVVQGALSRWQRVGSVNTAATRSRRELEQRPEGAVLGC